MGDELLNIITTQTRGEGGREPSWNHLDYNGWHQSLNEVGGARRPRQNKRADTTRNSL